MKLVHPLIENQIVFDENKINVLIIENRKFMSEFIQELNTQINGEKGRFVLSDLAKEIKIDNNMDLIIDYFNIDFNNRKILTRLYKDMQQLSAREEFYSKTTEIKNNIMKYLYDLEEKIDFEFSINEDFDIISIFKAVDVKIEIAELNFIEKLIEYIKILDSLCGIKVFTLLNLKSFISNDELEKLYQFFIYNKLKVLLVENVENDKKFDIENILIIDEDLCEI